MVKAPENTSTPGTAVEEVKKGGSLALPSFMQGQSGAGLENIGAEDVVAPRIRLLQAVSPEVEEFEDAKSGHFWHDMAQRNLGKEVDITLLYVDKRAILWRPRPEGGILARTDDLITWQPSNRKFEVKLQKSGKVVTWDTSRSVAASNLLEWGSADPDDGASQPAGTLMYNFLARLNGFPDLPPAVITMQRSSAKVARKLMGRLKVMGGAPLYGIKLIMSPFQDDGGGQKFWNYKFVTNGFVESESEFEENKRIYEAVSKTGLKVKEEDEDIVSSDASPAGHSADDGKGKY